MKPITFMEPRMSITPAPVNGAAVFCQWLIEEGVDTVFLVPGLQIDPLFAHLAAQRRFRLVVANHELAAGFMADGYARASHKLGICLSIGTIGATNTLTAAATALADDSAVLFVTGNVPACLRGQGAFQDGWAGGTNDHQLFQTLLGWSAVAGAGDLRTQLALAAAWMRAPHRRPAHLAIPFDVQQEPVTGTPGLDLIANIIPPPAAEALEQLQASFPLMANARKPVILAGPRALIPGVAGALRCFAETCHVPIATTLSAKGLLPEQHPLSLGNFGYGGSNRANTALLSHEVDLLVVLGADLNERDSLCWDPRLAAGREILLVDPKPLRAGGPLRSHHVIAADCAVALGAWLRECADRLRPLRDSAPTRHGWCSRWMELPAAAPITEESADTSGAIPLEILLTTMRQYLPDETVMVVDAGLHRTSAGQYWQARRTGAFFSACSLAPMGWAIAAAVGIQSARPQQPVVVLTGDGCMRMHGSELATLARYRLPVLVVVCDNRGYGSVCRRHPLNGPAAEYNRLPGIDWPRFAEALGVAGAEATNPAQLRHFLEQRAMNGTSAGHPALLAVRTPLLQSLPPTNANPSALSAQNFSRLRRQFFPEE